MLQLHGPIYKEDESFGKFIFFAKVKYFDNLNLVAYLNFWT